MAIQYKSYKFRLYPNAEQVGYFAQVFGHSRWLWNQMLEDKKTHYKSTGTLLQTTPAQYKEKQPWLRDVDSLALANVQLNLERAFKSFFSKRTRFPRWKSRHDKQSYKTNRVGQNIRLENHKIRLPKIGWVNLKQHREIEGPIKSATITLTTTGKYYVSILCEVDIPPLPKTKENIGIDLGLDHFVILSSGEKINNPRHLRKLSEKLTREQKILSRRRSLAIKAGRNIDNCKNYQKQKDKVARIHEKIANRRKDFLHKLSTRIIENQDVICIEDLSSSNLMKNRRLAKSIGDASWSSFVRMLEYKADWYDKKIVKISRWFPSSQLCSSCNVSSGKQPLSVRAWTCQYCGKDHDRDINASINILHEGLRILDIA